MDGPVNKASPAILALNPFVATADVVQGRNERLDSFGSPFTGLVDLVRPDLSGFDTGFGGDRACRSISAARWRSIFAGRCRCRCRRLRRHRSRSGRSRR